jgi:CheY-like chemotaxis protein
VVFVAALAATPQRDDAPVVLLVEDHPDTRQMYAQFLSSAFDVMEAADAEHALTLIDARRPDLVITDLSLPGMDGFDMIERLRHDPATRRIPVICLSGFGGHAHEERARESGCDLILQKPCLPDALAAAALQVLHQHEKDQAP